MRINEVIVSSNDLMYKDNQYRLDKNIIFQHKCIWNVIVCFVATVRTRQLIIHWKQWKFENTIYPMISFYPWNVSIISPLLVITVLCSQTDLAFPRNLKMLINYRVHKEAYQARDFQRPYTPVVQGCSPPRSHSASSLHPPGWVALQEGQAGHQFT